MARASLNDRRHVEVALLVVLRPTVVAVLVDRRLAVITRLPDLRREILGRRAVFPLIDAGRVAITRLLDQRIAVFGTLLDRRVVVVACELMAISDRPVAVVHHQRRAVGSVLPQLVIALVGAMIEIGRGSF